MSAPPPRLITEVRSEPATAAVLRRLAGRPALDAHCRGVAVIAVRLATELGLDDLRGVARAALLHDVGKLVVAAGLVHCEHGYRILTAAGLESEALAALHHHERWDGTGYPCGLAGEAIPLLARVIAVADACDALTSARRYRARHTLAEAASDLGRLAGTQLDPRCVDALLAANAGRALVA